MESSKKRKVSEEEVNGVSWKVTLLHSNSKYPRQSQTGAAAYDLFSVERLELKPGQRRSISVGLKIELPPNTMGRILPRSKLAVDCGIDTMAGVIDPYYKDEVFVLLINHGKTTQTIRPGERIAQIALVPILTPTMITVDYVPPKTCAPDSIADK